MRAKDVGEVDVKIRELEAKQNTTSMPLQEEKKLLKEIANLKASKQGFAQLTTLREARERNKSVMDELMIRSNDNHSKIQEVNSKLTEVRKCDDDNDDACNNNNNKICTEKLESSYININAF